ncbi:MAG: PaaI family thioesterase [Heliomarina sp.]|uniref:PaaI family thioesterase n=1 Tax=Heliomarina sp. TaxID=2917556 RepID=UPI0040586A92
MKIAEKLEELPSAEEALGVSGLEFMKRIQEGEFAGAPIARLLNFTLTSVVDGRVVFQGSPEFSMTNPLGTVHGGWYGTILDSAMACAVMTRIPQGSTYTTLEYKVNIIRPIPLGTLVDCVGITDHVGRSTGIAHGEIRGVSDGKLYATGSTTCIVMRLSGK